MRSTPELEGQERMQDGEERPITKFLLAEYDHVSQALFDANKTITQFFQFYLLILTFPITLAGVLFRVGNSALSMQSLLRSGLAPSMAVVFAVIAIVGLSMLVYIVNLRLDSLLYARTCNGVRKYFFQLAKVPVEEELWVRTLPRAIHLPRYRELRHFGAVVLAFGLMDSLYLAGAMVLTDRFMTWGILVVVGVFLLLHAGAYQYLVWYREGHYLRTHIIGLDVDGVIGDIVPAFCAGFAKLHGRNVVPEAITHIPVHECGPLGIQESEEHDVFHKPEFWEEMPVIPRASRRIKELKNVLGFRIHVFTYRPWPNLSTLKPAEYRAWSDLVIGKWWPTSLGSITKWLLGRRVLNRWAIWWLTRRWLKKNGIPYNRLKVEMGNTYLADPSSRANNRFQLSQKRQIRMFVDDDPAKVKKLANICDLVFLFDQPYNRNESNLPHNVERVRSWDELYRYVRDKL